MKNDQQPQRSETEKLQQQNPNPGQMAANDEKQRSTDRNADRGPQQIPVGNEEQDTQGSVAGMGE